MASIVVDGLEVPGDAPSLEVFREWVAELGERAPRVHFSRGRMHLEMTPQNVDFHGPLVQAVNSGLVALTKKLDLGRYYSPPTWITWPPTGLSTEPDGFVVLWETLRSGLVHVNPHRDVELIGRPDFALEVVSRRSAKKDLQDLVEDYAAAGVREYWIIDARGGDVEFRILLLGKNGAYREQRPDRAGWIESAFWAHAFRIERFTDRVGLSDFRLRVRPSRRTGRSANR